MSAVDDDFVSGARLREQRLDAREVADVHAAVRRAGVAAGGEVGAVVDGLATREEHRVGHFRVVDRRGPGPLLALDAEAPLARRRAHRPEPDIHPQLRLAADDPGQAVGALADADRATGQTALVQPARGRLRHPVVQRVLRRRPGHRDQPAPRPGVDLPGDRDPPLPLEPAHAARGRAAVRAGDQTREPPDLLQPRLQLADLAAGRALLVDRLARPQDVVALVAGGGLRPLLELRPRRRVDGAGLLQIALALEALHALDRAGPVLPGDG